MRELLSNKYYPSIEIAKRWNEYFFNELSEKIKDINKFAVMRYAYNQHATQDEKDTLGIETFLIHLMLKGEINYKKGTNHTETYLVLGGSILDYEAKFLRVKKSDTEEKRTKPLDKISMTSRIHEEMKANGVHSTKHLIPKGKKAIIAKTISNASNGNFSQKTIENKISYLGYKSENQPALKK